MDTKDNEKIRYKLFLSWSPVDTNMSKIHKGTKHIQQGSNNNFNAQSSSNLLRLMQILI